MIKTLLLLCLLGQSPAIGQPGQLKAFLSENFGAIDGFYAEFESRFIQYETDGSGVVAARGATWIEYRYDGSNHYIARTPENPDPQRYFMETHAWYDGKMSMLFRDIDGFHAATDGDKPRLFASKRPLMSPLTILNFTALPDSPPIEVLLEELLFVTAYEREEHTVFSFYRERRGQDRFYEFHVDREGVLRRFELCERPLPAEWAEANKPSRARLEAAFEGDPFDLRYVVYRIDYDRWDRFQGVWFPVEARYTNFFRVDRERGRALRKAIAASSDPDERLQLSLERYLLETYALIEAPIWISTFQVNPVFTKEDFTIEYPPGTKFAAWSKSDPPPAQAEPASGYLPWGPVQGATVVMIALSVLSGLGLIAVLWMGLQKGSRP